MSTRQDGEPSPIIGSRDELVAWVAAGSKPREQWRIGTEHEKFGFYRETHGPVPYEGPRGIRALMEELIARFGWLPIIEGGNVIALKRPAGQDSATVSLEPGGQFELSGAPLFTVHETAVETALHLDEVKQAGDALGIGFLGIGFTPVWTLAETPHMPKQRYGIMTRHMPTVGKRGLDMMYRTCTIQTNLDFSDEADMVKKLRASLALQPIATALFASSPLTESRPNGFKSMRSEVWRDTDASRTGMLPFAFEPGMGFERYVDYALDVPMYFVYRDGKYIDAAGASFRDFMAGRLQQLPGERPLIDDWTDHLTTLFPEVRLKRFLEMRGADGGRHSQIVALSAFWAGLLYDDVALDGAWEMVKGWSAEQRQALRDEVPRLGLEAQIGHVSVREIAVEAVGLARRGLKARGRLDAAGADETRHLAHVEETAATGMSQADIILDRFEGPWHRRVDPVFDEFAF